MRLNQDEILIVEDESLVALDIENSLSQAGFNVCSSVSSGIEAICFIEKQVPKLVLMDIKLKGELDGVSTAMYIRNRFSIPVVFLTAYSDDGILERAKNVEPYGYITKPFKIEDVISTVKMAIFKHQQENRRSENKTIQLTTCPWCKKSKDEKLFGEESWKQIEALIQNKIINKIDHCICPNCLLKLIHKLTRLQGENPDWRFN